MYLGLAPRGLVGSLLVLAPCPTEDQSRTLAGQVRELVSHLSPGQHLVLIWFPHRDRCPGRRSPVRVLRSVALVLQ